MLLINRNSWRTWRKKYLTVDGYMLDRILGKIKKIADIEKIDDTKSLIDADGNLLDDIT